MRTVRAILLTVIGLALVGLGVANMAPVDLHLVPPDLDPTGKLVLRGVPLAAVILAAAVLGVIIGQFLEWMRESRHRRLAAERKREVGRLRSEINRLSARLDDGDADLPELPVR